MTLQGGRLPNKHQPNVRQLTRPPSETSCSYHHPLFQYVTYHTLLNHRYKLYKYTTHVRTKMHLSNSIKVSLLLLLHDADALSITESSRAQTARSRLSEAFKSPSKKMTLHPELVLPEPSDPTALLLRASEVTKLSSVIRTRAKANAVFVEGTVDALLPMAKEQEDARGNFPGPVPIVYSWKDDGSATLTSCLEQLSTVDGVEGVLLPFFAGKEISSVDMYLEQMQNNPSLTEACGEIWGVGLQPIPEITLMNVSEWEETMEPNHPHQRLSSQRQSPPASPS